MTDFIQEVTFNVLRGLGDSINLLRTALFTPQS
jgi:hypothetical protein